MLATDAKETTARILTQLIRDKTGDGGARAHTLEALPGHAGISYSFICERTDGAASESMVVRVAPPGVKISGPADVIRQAQVMKTLDGSGVPVPPVIWFGEESEYFDRPYMVGGFVQGFKLLEEDMPLERQIDLATRGVEMLALLHSLDWRPHEAAFGKPVTLQEEVERLDYLLNRPTLDVEMTVGAAELRQALIDTMPADPHVGCVHGDFQWGNMLFGNDGPVALFDWELALIGPTLLDVGWLMLFADPATYEGGGMSLMGPLPFDEIAEIYTKNASYPTAATDFRWFMAFANYRLGVITCFNVMLHRRGKRIDPEWEVRAPSARLLFARGRALLNR